MVAPIPAVGVKESPIDVVAHNFESAAGRLCLHAELKAVLSRPARAIHAQLPVRMDDGTLRVFEAYRVQHSDVRGPYLGGLRYVPALTVEEVSAMSVWTSLRCAVANVPFGGAHGGVACDPAAMSKRELEALTRKYTACMHLGMGPYRDVHGPDVGSDSETMRWMLDEYSQLHEYSPACVTGKTVEQGGVPLYEDALTLGVAVVLRELAREHGEATPLRIAVQGLGASAIRMVLFLARADCIVVALSNGISGVHCADGIDIDAVVDHVQRGGKLHEIPGTEKVSCADVVECSCDVVIAAARDCALHARNARRIRANIVIEATGLASTAAADAVFGERGITVVPDLIAAAGPLVVSHLEWSQNLKPVIWDEARVASELEQSVRRAYDSTKQKAAEDEITLREAACCMGLERLARAEKLRLP